MQPFAPHPTTTWPRSVDALCGSECAILDKGRLIARCDGSHVSEAATTQRGHWVWVEPTLEDIFIHLYG